MLLPYNVDRPTRRPPYFTYGLMGINIFIFFLTVFISNIYLPIDRIAGQKAIVELIGKYSNTIPEAQNVLSILGTPKKFNPNPGSESMARTKNQIYKVLATRIAFERSNDPGGFKRLYQVQHADVSLATEPHYLVLDVFAYRPGENSFWLKMLGLFGSMFLHGSLDHLFGNMVFLWVFGRALEDTLGPRIYVGAYILCGIAATLLYHVITMQFTPQSATLPLIGASGAIAGVLGLFALRFYRTPVRIFYILPTTLPIVVLVWGFMGYLLYAMIGEIITSIILSGVAVLAFIFIYGRKWAWGTFQRASAWAIGTWLVLFNVVPAVSKLFSTVKEGGVAHWAHIGGFAFGMLYASLIGSKEEGKAEYMLEDAQKAVDTGDIDNAIGYAQNLLQREPGNGAVYEILGRSYDRRNNEEAALDNYEQAITHFVRSGERVSAARVYMEALKKHPLFIMPAQQQMAVGNQLAKDGDFKNAAENLVKIPYTFPEAPEGEISLLRAAQLYLEHLNQPEMTLQLLSDFTQRFPDSQYMPQAERGLQAAQAKINSTNDAQY